MNILLGVLYLSVWLILSRCRQYYFVNQSVNWGDAVQYCRKNYVGLANIGNTEEMTQLHKTVSSAGYNSEVWIGVYFGMNGYSSLQINNDFWQWANQTANEPFLVYYWCGRASVNGWNWYYECSVEHPFICYNGTVQSPEYTFVNVSMDWFRALRYCKENFTDLPLPWGSLFDFLKLMPNGVQPWIGYLAIPRIFWIDGTDSSFRYWDDSKKISGMFGSLYGVADLQRSGKWRLIDYNTALPFVCYDELPAPQLNTTATPGKAIVPRKVIKMRLKLENPSVDLNEAAVKANLLKKLQDRLKEKGVNGVTLRWREQPDGAVFHKEEKKPQKTLSCEF